MPLSAGTRLGPYEILAPIGSGGMGEVYKARDTRLDRTVAIKVAKEQFTERFTREARSVAALNHTNVCQLYDVGPDFIVLEYVEGATLQGPLALEDAMPLIQQLIDGIEAAHEKNIVHRDLKPANIKITPEGVVKILDFGLAKAMEPPREESSPENSPTLTVGATQAGTILGTAAYMSPEQAKGKTADKRSDIWSFGVILYELLTGQRPFQGETATEVLGAVLHKEPDWNPVPARMRKLLQCCLQKDRKLRLSAIGDARWMMEEQAPEGQATAPSLSRLSFVPWVVAGVAVLAFAGVSAIHFRERPPEPAKPVRFQFIPEKVAVGSSGFFAVSPDGTKLAYYAAGSDGVTRLWIRQMDTLESRPLSATGLNATIPIFWSHDNRFVLFQSTAKLQKIDVSGGPAQSLCDLSGFVGGLAIGGSANPEGTILFGSVGGVLRVSSEGGTAKQVTTLDATRGESRHLGPVFLPDGRHFLYLRVGKPGYTGIYLGLLDAKPEQQSSRRLLATQYIAEFVPFEDGRSGEILFLREGTLFAQRFDLRRLELTGEAVPVAEQVGSILNGGSYSSSLTGALVYRSGSGEGLNRLAWFDRQGKTLGTPTEAFYGPATLTLSPDGSRAVAHHTESSGSNLWMVDLTRGGRTRFTYTQAGDDLDPAWSPDGTKIAFTSNRLGHFDLFQRAANGAGEDEVLLKSDSEKFAQDWSRDGRSLLFSQIGGKAGVDLWVLPMDGQGERKPVPFLRSEFISDAGRFSPDGHWVTYESNESGTFEIYVRPFPAPAGGGEKSMVSQSGGMHPHWRRDGKELFYLRPDGEVMAADVSASGAAFQPGIPKPLFKAPGGPAWDVSADGQKFLFPIAGGDTTQSPFTVVLNWPSLLKK